MSARNFPRSASGSARGIRPFACRVSASTVVFNSAGIGANRRHTSEQEAGVLRLLRCIGNVRTLRHQKFAIKRKAARGDEIDQSSPIEKPPRVFGQIAVPV